MLKYGQPMTPAPASPLNTPIAKDAAKQINKKQKVVEESSASIEISLSAGVSAFKDYKALIKGANQFVLQRDAKLLRDSGVLNTIDRSIAIAFQKKKLDTMELEELRRKNVERAKEEKLKELER
ncbi:hypothetical protein ACOSQ2_004826 [Xanthoceras sorbifolium]